MKGIIAIFVENFKSIEAFSAGVLYYGLKLSCGLLLLSLTLYLMVGRYGDLITVYSCAKGAFDAATGVFIVSFLLAFIGDIAIKERKA